MFTTEKVTIWVYAILYIIGFILTFFMKVQQPTKEVEITNQVQTNEGV